MNDIGKRLKEARVKKGLTQNQLAEILQCSDKAISCYENNKNLEKVYDFQKICEYLNVNITYLITGKENNNGKEISKQEQQILNAYRKLSDSDRKIVDYILNGIDNSNIKTETIKIYRLPEYDQSAAAGVGQLGKDSHYHMEEYTIDNIPNNGVFTMKIVGESMYDKKTDYLIHTGSVVLINPKFNEYELNNKIVITNFKGKVICKRYINKGNYILFQSDNDEYKEENRKSSDDPNCKVLGIVLGVIEDNTFISVD